MRNSPILTSISPLLGITFFKYHCEGHIRIYQVYMNGSMTAELLNTAIIFWLKCKPTFRWQGTNLERDLIKCVEIDLQCLESSNYFRTLSSDLRVIEIDMETLWRLLMKADQNSIILLTRSGPDRIHFEQNSSPEVVNKMNVPIDMSRDFSTLECSRNVDISGDILGTWM